MKRLAIHRHPDCDRCARFARVHRALDWLNRLVTTTKPPPGAPVPKGKIAVVDLTTGARLRHEEAMPAICRQVPAYWPLLALLQIPAMRRRFAQEIAPDGTQGCHGAFHLDHRRP